MILGIDAREIQDGVKTGIGRALEVYLRWFAQQDGDDRGVLFSSTALPGDFGTRISNVVAPRQSEFAWDQFVLRKLAAQSRIDVLFSPYYKVPLRPVCAQVSTIFDLMYLSFPTYRNQLPLTSRLYYATVGRMMAHKADAIFTCSEYSKSEIVDFHRVSKNKVTSILLGLSDAYQPETRKDKIAAVRKRFGISGEFILYSGNFKPHKNVKTLVKAFTTICKEHPNLKLVLAGGTETMSPDLEACIAQSSACQNIVKTGRVGIEDQVALYSDAKLLVIPSLYEGFGYPPLEAMACGTPVVSSCVTSLPEVVGDAALLVDATSSNQIADAIMLVLRDSSLSRELIRKGREQTRKFDETTYSEKLHELLTSVCGSHSRRRCR